MAVPTAGSRRLAGVSPTMGITGGKALPGGGKLYPARYPANAIPGRRQRVSARLKSGGDRLARPLLRARHGH